MPAVVSDARPPRTALEYPARKVKRTWGLSRRDYALKLAPLAF